MQIELKNGSTKRYYKVGDLKYDDDNNPLCRWCGNIVKKPRRTICSKKCEHEVKLRCFGKYLKQCVYKRDKGICDICNIDTKKIANIALNLNDEDRKIFLSKYNINSKRKIYFRRYGGSLWDADHILPVKDGGGCCGLDNIRTLCIQCHKLITKTSYQK